MTGPGRPSTGVPIQVRIPAEDIARLDAAAQRYGFKRAGITRAELIRQIVTEWLDEDER